MTPDEKAKRVLHRHLSEEQRLQLQTQDVFHVTTPAGNTYRLQLNVRGAYLVTRRGIHLWCCIHPNELLPAADNALSLKLILEGAEREFLRIANVSYTSRAGQKILNDAKRAATLVSRPIGPAIKTSKFLSRWANRRQ